MKKCYFWINAKLFLEFYIFFSACRISIQYFAQFFFHSFSFQNSNSGCFSFVRRISFCLFLAPISLRSVCFWANITFLLYKKLLRYWNISHFIFAFMKIKNHVLQCKVQEWKQITRYLCACKMLQAKFSQIQTDAWHLIEWLDQKRSTLLIAPFIFSVEMTMKNLWLISKLHTLTYTERQTSSAAYNYIFFTAVSMNSKFNCPVFNSAKFFSRFNRLTHESNPLRCKTILKYIMHIKLFTMTLNMSSERQHYSAISTIIMLEHSEWHANFILIFVVK